MTALQTMVGGDLLLSGKRPTTSSLVQILSGRKENRLNIKLNPFIQSKEDVSRLFQEYGLKDEELEERYKGLVHLQNQMKDSSYVEISSDKGDVKDFILSYLTTPSQLRMRPVIEKVEITAPLFGLNNKGISLIDSPGTGENEYLDTVSLKAVLDASIVVYIFDVNTSFKHEEDIEFIKKYAKSTIFVLNIHDEYNEEDISATKTDLRIALGENQPLDIMELDVQGGNYTEVEQKICFKLYEISNNLNRLMMSQIFAFSRHLFNLINRLISLHLDNKEKPLRNLKISHSDALHSLRSSIKNLATSMHAHIRKLESKYDKRYLEVLETTQEMLKNTNTIPQVKLQQSDPHEEDFANAFLSFLNYNKPSNIELELFERIKNVFSFIGGLGMNKALYEISSEAIPNIMVYSCQVFQEIYTESLKLESDVHKMLLFSQMVSNLGRYMRHVIQLEYFDLHEIGSDDNDELSIFLSIVRNEKLWLKYNHIESLSNLKYLGISGFKKMSTDNMKNSMIDHVFEGLQKRMKQKEYYQMREQFISPFKIHMEQILAQLKLLLLVFPDYMPMNLVSVDFDYNQLCVLLNMKEQILGTIEILHTKFVRHDYYRSTNRNDLEKSSLCFVCSECIHKCHHLCRRCDYFYGNKDCPFCSKRSTWVKENLNDIQDSQLKVLLNDIAFCLLDPTMDDFTQHYLRMFCKWFIERFEKADSNQINDMKNSINLFVKIILENHKDEKTLYYQEKVIILNTLFGAMFEGFGYILISQYHQMYQAEDQEYLEVCRQNSDMSIPATIFEDQLQLDKAIKQVRNMAKFESPFLKFECLVQMSNAIQQAQSKMLDTDDLYNAISFVFLKAEYPHLVSELHLVADCLLDFFEEEDVYLLITVTGLADTLKKSTEYPLQI